MASPQLENGHIKIANEIWDALIRYRLPGEQRQVLDLIIRKTYGFQKKQDAISLSQFVKYTGINKPNVVRAINGLLSKKIIFVIKKDNTPAQVYEFNKNYSKWVSLSKKITTNMPGRVSIEELKAKIRKRDNNTCMLCGLNGTLMSSFLPVHHIDFDQTNNNDNNLITLCKSCHAKSHTIIQRDKLSKKITGVIKKDNKSLSKKIPTKDNTKATITKATPPPPNFINSEIWIAFLEMRKKKKSYPTDYAIKLLFSRLEKFKNEGQDPNEILKISIENGWKGVFPLDEKKQGGCNDKYASL